MNVEFHYYSTAFLAVKAGFSLADATTLAFASQYVDHHHRALEISTGGGIVFSAPTQNYSFWDPETVSSVLAPFHFFPAGEHASVRADGRTSVWEVRPNSPGAKALLVEALRSRDLYRIGLALHTFSDTWAHQNFTARDEEWNRLKPTNRLPAPGHAHAGWAPDLWLAEWDDPRLLDPLVVNKTRYLECARKVYRYLRTFRGEGFEDEPLVAEELDALIETGRGRDTVEDRSIDFVLTLNLEPYERGRWLSALEEPEETDSWPLLKKVKKAGSAILDRAGLNPPQRHRAKPGFEQSPLACWLRAADEHRALARQLIQDITGDSA